jgi:hypothetical protein
MYLIGTPLALKEGDKDSEGREVDFAGARVYG